MSRKPYIALLMSLLLFSLVSCNKMVQQLSDLHLEMKDLQASVEKLNTSVEQLAAIVSDISVNQIVDVQEILDESGIRTGYTLIYKNGKTVDILNGTDGSAGQDGTDGKDGRDGRDGRDGNDGRDGRSPYISVKEGTDGRWYWMMDGEPILDEAGNMIPVGSASVTPRLKIENGYWYYSFDNGVTWVYLYQATTSPSSIFKTVDYKSDPNFVIITLTNGTQYKLPKFVKMEFTLPSQKSYYIFSGESVMLPYSVLGGTGSVDVSITPSEHLTCEIVKISDESGRIVVTADDRFVGGKLLVCMRRGYSSYITTFDFSVKLDGLSRNGTANCYIVPKNGTHRFFALYKGNSSQLIDGTPAGARLLWESYGNLVPPQVGALVKDVHLNGNYIEFSTDTFENGNAVVAVVDKDNKILWSWHLWITEYDPDVDNVRFDSHPDNPLMSINLGALSSTRGDIRINGLIYQYGRKDPFLGLGEYDNSQKRIESSVIWPAPMPATVVTGCREFTTENPMVFLSQTSNYGGWDYNCEEGWISEKTLNDPCPPGWKVPKMEDSWSFSISDQTRNYTLHGIEIPQPLSKPAAWFPFTGCLYAYETDEIRFHNYHDSCLWAVNRYSNDINGARFDSRWSGMSRCYGISVRCISIEKR